MGACNHLEDSFVLPKRGRDAGVVAARIYIDARGGGNSHVHFAASCAKGKAMKRIPCKYATSRGYWCERGVSCSWRPNVCGYRT
eukprot:396386-Pleurochrysis_carterae.AAC.2